MKSLFKRVQSSLSSWVHSRRTQNRLQVGSALALGAGLFVSALLYTGLFDSLQWFFSDLLYQTHTPSGQVVIVAVDDASLKAFGDWPWPRSRLIDLVDAVSRAKPKVVALDILLSESSPYDQTFSRALSSAPAVVLPVAGTDPIRLSSQPFPGFAAILTPASTLQTVNTTLGHTLVTPDADGVVRRIPIAIQSSGKRYAAFGISAVERFQDSTLTLDSENGLMTLGSLRLPVDDQGQIYLNFTSPEAEQVISSVDVLNSRVDAAALRDKIVLIGMMSSTTPERFKTPIALEHRPLYPVEIQANLMETLLGNHLLVEQDRLSQIVVIFLVALLAGATLTHFRLLSSTALAIIYLLMYLSYAFEKFGAGILVQPLYPTLALFLTYAATMTFRYFSIDRPLGFVRRLIRRSVGPEAVDQALHALDDGTLPIHGVRRTASILYIDLRELGTVCSTIEPEAAIHLLNQYINMAVTSIFHFGGTVTKNTGDTILAVWNLPLDQADHAQSAVRAAVEIQHEVHEFGKHRQEDKSIQIGIAIATGEVVAGPIGGSVRGEYAVIGETVSMAERMAIKPDRGVFVDAATRELIAEEFETHEVNPVRLRRKTDPQMVWEISPPMELEHAEDVKQSEETHEDTSPPSL